MTRSTTATRARRVAPLAMPRRGDAIVLPPAGRVADLPTEQQAAREAAHRLASSLGHTVLVCERSLECSRCPASGSIAPTARGWVLRGNPRQSIIAPCDWPFGDHVWIEPALLGCTHAGLVGADLRIGAITNAASFAVIEPCSAFAPTGATRPGAPVYDAASQPAIRAERVRLQPGMVIVLGPEGARVHAAGQRHATTLVHGTIPAACVHRLGLTASPAVAAATAAWNAIAADPERLAAWAVCCWLGRLASAGGAS